MAEVNHRYIGRIPSESEQERQAETRSTRRGVETQAHRRGERARQKLHAAKLLAMKGELISKKHAMRQSAFLVISLRQRGWIVHVSAFLAPALGSVDTYGDGEVRSEYLVEGVAHCLSDEILQRLRGLERCLDQDCIMHWQ